MSTYIISDIHGCNKTFRKALKSIKLKKSDSLIILGDLIDRGPDSKGVLDTIFLLLEHNFSVTCIKGNHEQMFIDSFNDVTEKVKWIRNGGKETLASFLTSDLNRIPEKYIDYIKSFKNHLIIDDYILVHAGINMTLDNPLADEQSLLWLRDWENVYDKEWLGGRKVIHGHTPLTRLEIKEQFLSEKKVWCVDNGSYLRDKNTHGSICVLQLEDLTLHFENQLDNEYS